MCSPIYFFSSHEEGLSLTPENNCLKIFSNKIDTAAPVSTSKVSFLPETSRSTRIGLTEGLPMVSACIANSPSVLATLKSSINTFFPALLSTCRFESFFVEPLRQTGEM